MSRPRQQGAVLIVGAVVTYLLLEVGEVGFHWTPFLLGLSYLAAAFLGGRRGSYWATGLVLTTFGLGPLALFELEVDVGQAATYVACLGVAVLLAAVLARGGWAITQEAVGATILALGVIYLLQPELDQIEEPLTYLVALGAVGLARLATGGRRRR